MKAALLLAAALLAGCTSYSGRVVDYATLPMEGVREVIVPHDATVRKDGTIGRMRLSMEKSLAVQGPDSGFHDIDWTRRNMGVAARRDDHKLELATFGEFDNGPQGQARMVLGVQVPDGTAITRKQGNSGPDSIGNNAGKDWLKHTGD